MLNLPFPRHGQVCGNAYFALREFLNRNPLGHVVCNHPGIRREHDPDRVYGGDVWYVSYDKVSRGAMPQRYLDVVPDLLVNVISPTERWSQILANVAEYLELGIAVVCILDPDERMVRQYYPDRPEMIDAGTDLVKFPELLPGFEVQAQQFFE